MRELLLCLFLIVPVAQAQLVPGNGKGVSMGHIHLRVSDVEVHKKLWIEALGAKVVRSGRLELYEFPGVQMGLIRGQPTGGTEGCVIDHLGFKVKNLAETKEKLLAAGATLVSENAETRQMFIEFPDGIKVEFTEDTAQTEPVVHDHIHFAVPEIEEQRKWYAEKFGAVPAVSRGFQAADLPGVNLRWKLSDARLAGNKGRAIDHIGFEIKGLEDFCKELEAAGVKFDLPYRSFPRMGISIAFLTDPWGVYIELTEGLVNLR